MASSTALAVPIVTDWSYSLDSTFTTAIFTTGTGNKIISGDELSWGATGGDFQSPVTDFTKNRSALTIGNGTGTPTLTGGGPATGSVKTVLDGAPPELAAGEIGIGTNMTHWNNPISSSFATLESGILRDTLTLTATAPNAGAAYDLPVINFDFRFAETPNGGTCAGGTANPCGDIWGIFAVPTLDISFIYDTNQYFGSILVLGAGGSASPIDTLLDAQCDAVGYSSGCQGFLTAESAATTVQFAFAVSSEPLYVPEPATLALMGLGLAGIGFRRQRSKKTA